MTKLLKARDVYTVEMMVELTEEEYVDLGIGRALVRNMLRKARGIVTPSAIDSSEMMLVSLEADAEFA